MHFIKWAAFSIAALITIFSITLIYIIKMYLSTISTFWKYPYDQC